ncbi:MAG: DNA mismatch repair protein MutS [Kordia sp.]|nr:MAG: DNA mismatch repair protein MutS [Kordia sp.]
MNTPLSFYTAEVKRITLELRLIKKRLVLLSTLRFSIFIVTAILGYVFIASNALVPILILGTFTFIFLLYKYTATKKEKKLTTELLHINELEIAVIDGDLSNLSSGKKYINPKHFYSYDIDLFGEGSFFQFINRTATKAGTKILAELITANTTDNIPSKQEMLKELSETPKWRQRFSAIARVSKTETKGETILKWIQTNSSFVPKLFQYLPLLFSAVSCLLIVLYFTDFIPLAILLLWFMIGLSITGKYLAKINKLYNDANKVGATFKQISLLLHEIEQSNFKNSILIAQKERIANSDKKASVLVNDFSKALDAFDQRNNMLFGFFANGLLLWDLKQCYRIETWIKNYATNVENWFEAISFFDAQNSLANFIFNKPDYTFPTIGKTGSIINAENLGHPLLQTQARVDNDYNIAQHEFFIITGANMAGKSTFLRTVSLSIVMANTGLPICATKCDYTPIKLITSMRTSDSLKDNESYFFSELKRLKFIVDQVQQDDYFIILDEILKGTNSQDKAIGSKKFVERLVSTNATGIIATHDLSLCTIEKELSQIKNFYFDAEIKNDELYFDYTFKKGVCKNMNASFLLKKMEIVN